MGQDRALPIQPGEDMTLYENRSALHRYMATPESCDRCHGRGWHPETVSDDPDDLHEVYCQCPAGDERKRVEAPPNESEGDHG